LSFQQRRWGFLEFHAVHHPTAASPQVQVAEKMSSEVHRFRLRRNVCPRIFSSCAIFSSPDYLISPELRHNWIYHGTVAVHFAVGGRGPAAKQPNTRTLVRMHKAPLPVPARAVMSNSKTLAHEAADMSPVSAETGAQLGDVERSTYSLFPFPPPPTSVVVVESDK